LAESLSPEVFLDLSRCHAVLDVRSPGEYREGHIPGALSMPLFSDEERARVGTLYKQKGRQEALLEGLDIVGPKMSSMVRQAQSVARGGQVLVHCWRGGMRSSSVAWLLEQSGLKVGLLAGGYKAYRQHIRQIFCGEAKLVLLGGMTGCGKTDLLHLLVKSGEQVLDLEGLANHRGSAFGAVGQPPQPSTEHFENLCHSVWSGFDLTRHIWVENESLKIGTCIINPGLYENMLAAPMVRVNAPLSQRLDRLERDYGECKAEELVGIFDKISKRLGGDRCRDAQAAVMSGDLRQAAQIALAYYDKAYENSSQLRHHDLAGEIDLGNLGMEEAVERLLALSLNFV